MDFDLPSLHANLVDHESDELLALLEVELVDAGGGAGSEVTNPPPELVVGDELSALGRQFLAAASELPASSIDVANAPLHLVQIEKPGLVHAGPERDVPSPSAPEARTGWNTKASSASSHASSLTRRVAMTSSVPDDEILAAELALLAGPDRVRVVSWLRHQ